MKCTSCQFESAHSVRFCGSCGTSLIRICGSCGFANPLDFRFCGDCGKLLSKNPAAPIPSKTALPEQPILKIDQEAERRHLTVMFCDLVGSTALSSRLDPEDLRHIVTEYQKVCQKIVARFEGHIAQYLGDGILVYFGYPIAHENDAHRAVSAGLAIIEAMEQLNVQLETEKGVEIQVRIGIHTGHTVVGDILSPDGQNQRLAHGATLNIAARLEGLATPDTIVISWITYALIHRHFVCEDRGEHLIKGIDKSVHIYRVISENTARTRLGDMHSLSNKPPLFGRDAELNKLLELWDAAKEGRSHIALLNGGAGVGKSRLLQALTQKVAEDDDAWLIAHQCSPYHQKTPFYPIAFGIKHVALRIEGHESTAEQINRLEGFIIQNGLLREEMMPLFAGIMNISLEESDYQPSPFSLEQQHDKIVDALINIYLKRAKKQPVLLTFEDLHWIDNLSLRVLDKMIQQAPTSRILVVLSFRPSFQIPWGMKSHLIPISLGNLSDEAIRAIIQKISIGKRLPEDLIQKIIQKTDGVPLFVEELTKMVLNSDMVTEFEEHFELNKPIDSLAIPSTLQDSLIARLNNMADSKSVAQIGATIGRQFDYALIKTIAGMGEDSLRFSLEELVQTELLLQEGLLPQATFKFRHALIRDAAYQSLLNSQQKKIHLKIANVLTTHFAEQVEDRPQVAAYHFEKSNQPKLAILHWTNAGEKSRKRQAFSEALDYLERGLNLLQEVDKNTQRDELELALLSIQAPIFVITTGFTSKSAYRASKRIKELAEKLGDNISWFHALRTEITYQLFAEKPQNAFRSAQKALGVAKAVGEPDLLIEAYRLIGQTSNYTGKYQDSLDSFNEAIGLYLEKEGKRKYHFVTGDSHIFCLVQSCQSLWYLGYPDQATQRAKEALSKAAEKEQIFVQAIGLFMGCYLSVLRGDIKTCANYAESCMKICNEYGIEQILGEIKIYEAYLLLKNGQIEKGIELIELAFYNRIEHNVKNGIHFHFMSIIQAYLDMGAIQKGLDLVAKSLANFEMSGDQLCLSEIYRLKGELLFAKNRETHLAEISACFESSWQLTQAQGAKSFELRTAMSMARLRQHQNDREAAFQVLSKTYGWFTEGFDTADLKEAKVLLNTLASK